MFIKSKKADPKSLAGEKFLLIFFLTIIASSFISLNRYKSLEQLPKFISYFFIFYAVYLADRQQRQKILAALILTAGAVSLFAIVWFYFGAEFLLLYLQKNQISYPFAEQFIGRQRAFMPFILPSALAGYLMMMLAVTVGYLIQDNKQRFSGLNLKNILLSLSILLMISAVLLTKSTGAWLSIFLALFIFMILSGLINEKTALVVLILQLAFMSLFILRSFNTELATSSAYSIQNRLTFWKGTLAVILKHPVSGVGLGNLPFVQSKFTHNSYLQIWAEMGIVAIASLLLFLSKSLKNLVSKNLAKNKIFAGLIIAHLFFLIHNLIEFSFFLPEVCVFWWIILALLLGEFKLGVSQNKSGA
ncbi:O-antigen ligase family protein [Candidatus Omnitrophota bacterium]